MSSTIEGAKRHAIGASMKRKEDPRLIRGRGRFVDDISLPQMLHLALVHSPYPHARIKNIDTTAALAVPGVTAILTAKDLEGAGLAWIPTFHGYDKQMVLAVGKVLYQYQEVAGVIAETRDAAHDAAELVEVEYEPLEPVVDPFVAREDKTILRDDRENKTNHIYHWEVGDRAATDAAMAASEVHVKEQLYFQRCHPAPLEPCGIIADMNRATGRLTLYLTSQAPHAHRTVVSLVTGIPEDKIRVVSPDIGGGFGNKVPVYPGYVVAAVASVVLKVPVKWIETRTENLTTTGFARDYHMDVEIGATKEGKVTALKVATVADHGAFDAAADPTKYPAGLFGIVTGSYDFPVAFTELDAYFTNKAPGGIAYRCSFRVTEASYAIERGMDILAQRLGIDSADLRRKNFIPKESFPYRSPLGFEYDSGDYQATLSKALDGIGYTALRAEQADKRTRGELMGIGISTFTEVVGAGPSKHFDIMGIKMFDSAEIRDPTWSARASFRRQPHQELGHEDNLGADRSWKAGPRPSDLLVPRATPIPRPAGSALRTRAAALRRPSASNGAASTSARRRARSRPTCSRSRKTTSSGRTTSSKSRASPARRSA